MSRVLSQRNEASDSPFKKKGGSPEDARQRGFDMLNVLEMNSSFNFNWETVTSQIQVVTPDMARALRETAHFDRQRKISKPNVMRLASEMVAGRFTDGTQIYICVLPDGTQKIVNGNHTLQAVVECGVPQLLTITRKAVANEDEAGRVYAVFDIQKTRSWGDSLRAVGKDGDIPNAKFILAALGTIDARFGTRIANSSASRLARIDKMDTYRDAAFMFAEAIHNAPKNSSRLVKRSGVLAVALETMVHQPSLAFEFWRAVAQDNGLTADMPERALLNWLRNSRSSGGALQRDHCAAAALAWNAVFRGESRSFIRPSAMASFFLLGTPLANGLGD
jgi:hypothetical protein